MEQPDNFTHFQSGWWSFDLPEYRPCESTYMRYQYDSIPPLPDDLFKEKLQWLVPLDNDIEKSMRPYRPSQKEQAAIENTLKTLIPSAQQKGLPLPDSFVQLMASKDLQYRIPSCTACYFDLSKDIIPCPEGKEGFLIRFLNDQQMCLSWYLYITPKGRHCVLVSSLWLDKSSYIALSEEEEDEDQRDEQHAISDYIFFCAPSFEAFIYRFWMENVCWYNLHEHKPLTDEQQHYLAHYMK